MLLVQKLNAVDKQVLEKVRFVFTGSKPHLSALEFFGELLDNITS